MDSDNLSSAGGLEVAHQNGVYPQLWVAGDDINVLNGVNGKIEETVESCLLNGRDDNGATGEAREGLNDLIGNSGLIDYKEGEVKDNVDVKQCEPWKVQCKTKNEKPSGPKIASSVSMKKGKDENIVEARLTTSNGRSIATNSHPKQPPKSRSCNEGQANASKRSEKTDAAFSKGPFEKPKLKPLKKGTLGKAEGDTESCPTEADAKPCKVGSLPNYGFSFKCDERAEKRKEFYTKLEEKIQAKEEEKSNLQAKSKETQEAEIKMFRKGLNFKATPMPSFYQEAPPPKMELKKIPPTRAKSPKLGRRKGSTPSDSDGNSNNGHQSILLSLDEKAFRCISSKVISPVNAKKPQRKSLPKLPSQKVSLSGKTNEEKTSSREKFPASSKATNEGKVTSCKATPEENSTISNVTNEGLSPALQQQAASAADSGEHQSDIDQEISEADSGESQHNIDQVPDQEPIASEH
ncbi:protein WVD2-like 6 [Hibiscus syriacus]|uniref:protein WVD2-like 6 n=1 Tax=Hibiscus syriacus TaxID=106335 RepID=UPI001921678A|nr:protein WVD2-like 6 [Hibiscus syriacus]XP_039055059.1 protein WVD2-like 6 [Hibiscus syriacus]XP_039055060.1 protein WVD2-like 6 [Hibiscus syriacus]XP_039055061.1 protein WVD2-like 6 [Hibiscus syriacus]